MIDGNVDNFIESLLYEDAYILYQGKKYFINGCSCRFDNKDKMIDVRLEVYNLDDNCTIFSTVKATHKECISEFESARIFNGKSFWEAEKDIQWVDN